MVIISTVLIALIHWLGAYSTPDVGFVQLSLNIITRKESLSGKSYRHGSCSRLNYQRSQRVYVYITIFSILVVLHTNQIKPIGFM